MGSLVPPTGKNKPPNPWERAAGGRRARPSNKSGDRKTQSRSRSDKHDYRSSSVITETPGTPKLDTGRSARNAAGTIRELTLPDGFMRSQGGICFNPKGEGTKPFFVCREFNILAQTRDELGKAWGLWLHWIDSDKREHNWAMPMSMLAGDGADIRAIMLDAGFQIATDRQGRAKFLELLATAKVTERAHSVDRVGWVGSTFFALPDRTIGDASIQRVIYQGSDALDHAYRVSGTLEAWQNTVARYGVGNSRIAVALSAAFVGPLLTLLGEEGGGINLRGPSSIGKSTALIGAASVWGPPSFVRQWRATTNGLEGICVQHNETFLGLDELSQLDPRDAGTAAYLIANGLGKARAGRSGALRAPAKWSVMFLSSGEISLADLAGSDPRGAKRSAAGQEIRILDCEADAGTGLGLFENLHDASSAEALARQIKAGAAAVHGTAGPAFVEKLIGNREEATTILKNEISTFVADNVALGASGQVARAGRRFGLIAAAGELAIRLEILPWPQGEARNACAMMFQQWMAGRGGIGAAEDREAIAKVRAFLEMHGGSRFEAVNEDEATGRIINRAGFWRDVQGGREYLFLRETWKNEVCAGIDANRVAKVLGERGLLRRDSAGKNSISVNLPGGIGKTRCYVVTTDIFEGEANS